MAANRPKHRNDHKPMRPKNGAAGIGSTVVPKRQTTGQLATAYFIFLRNAPIFKTDSHTSRAKRKATVGF